MISYLVCISCLLSIFKDSQQDTESYLRNLIKNTALSCIMSYHIPNDSLYFGLPSHTNDGMITFLIKHIMNFNPMFQFKFF